MNKLIAIGLTLLSPLCILVLLDIMFPNNLYVAVAGWGIVSLLAILNCWLVLLLAKKIWKSND